MQSEESVSGGKLHKGHAGRCKAKTNDGILVSFDRDIGLARKILWRSRDEGNRRERKLIGAARSRRRVFQPLRSAFVLRERKRRTRNERKKNQSRCGLGGMHKSPFRYWISL